MIDTPTIMVPTATENSIAVSWDSIDGAVGYDVEVDGIIIDCGNVLNYVQDGLEPGTSHYFRIRARGEARTSDWSGISTIWTLPDIPGEVKITNTTETEITVAWGEVTGATGYDVEVDGTVIENISNPYTSGGLLPGTEHVYRVRAKNSSGVGKWSEIIQKRTIPGVINNMIWGASETEITLSWDSVMGATGYDIEIDGQVYENIESPYLHTGLLPGTQHGYKVRAKNESGIGRWSIEQTVWTLPDIPSNISLSSTSTSITISWDPVLGATGYDIEVYGSAVNNGPSISYTHTGLEPNTQRTYRVRAKNSSGAGQWSSIVAKTTAPGTPTNITIAATDNSLELVWDGMAGATGYDIEVDGKEVIEVENNLYVHTGLLSNSEHTYRIRSKNGEGMSEWSEPVKGITLPQTPADFRVSKAISSEITLVWDAVDGATGYDIEVDGTVLGIGNVTEYNHIGLKPNTEHNYRVRARNGSITGAWTEVLSRTTLLPAPANLTATASSNDIHLEWDMVIGAESYDIEMDGGEILNISGIEYTHSELMPNSSHTYRVRANNGNGAGDWSESLTLKTMFDKPQNVTFSASDNEITIRWDAADGAESYEVLVDGDIVDNGADSTFVHKDLKPNSMHIYKIRAKNSEYTGEWSEPIAIFTLVGIPANIKTSASSSEIVVSWDEVDGAETYEIEADGNVISLGTETKFTHVGLNSNTAHNYRVRAINVNGAGRWSELVSQITAPSVPVNLKAESDINSIKLTWNKVGAGTYDIEVDGKVIKGVQGETYTVEGLEPNTRHEFRIRARNKDGVSSDWSGLLAVNTIPELVLNIGIDTAFNFVIVVPKKDDVKDCRIVVIYNPEQMEAADLYAGTQPVELQPGQIRGTSIVIEEFTPGRVVYRIDNMDKAVITIIKFVSKTNDPMKVSYTIE